MSKYDDRIKIRCIVRTLLLTDGPKTAKELSQFIMFNGFRFQGNVSTQTINHIVSLDKKSNGILRDVEVTKTKPRKYYINGE